MIRDAADSSYYKERAFLVSLLHQRTNVNR